MARSTVELTTTFQSIATGRCTITLLAAGQYVFNDANSDTAADAHYYLGGEQVIQTDTSATTYGRVPSGTASIIVDTEA